MSTSKLKLTGNVLFREAQHFRVKWVWMIIISGVVVCIGITTATVYLDKESKDIMALLILIPVESLMLYLFYIVKLETVVTSDGVFYRWRPFFRKYSFIEKKEIDEAKPDKGPALSYGYHYLPGYGNVHNMGPGKGMRFVLKGGKRIFIGTQKLNGFQSAVEEIIKIQ
ncbi:MAG: hypothetical protein ABUT20_23405 [Bacteroidota bacterium]